MAYDPTDEIFAELERKRAEAEAAEPRVDPVLSGGLLPPEVIEADRAKRAAEAYEEWEEENRFRLERSVFGWQLAMIGRQIRRNNRG